MTRIIAHRGGALLWPENSLTAFRGALAAGADALECDVHLSADGEAMVMHDATLDRTSEGRGPLGARTASELAGVRLTGAGGEGVPRLLDLLGIVAGSSASLQVEVKADAAGRVDPRLLPRCLAEIDRAGPRARAEIIAFDAGTVAAAVAAGGLREVAWLFGAATLREIGLEGVLATAARLRVPAVETHEAALDAATLAALRGAGLRVGCWGANREPAIRRMLGLGADAIATDDPVLALALRDAARAG